MEEKTRIIVGNGLTVMKSIRSTQKPTEIAARSSSSSSSSSSHARLPEAAYRYTNPFGGAVRQDKSYDTSYTPEQLQAQLKAYYNGQMTIKRLFYPDCPIPMDGHYINLSILLGAAYQEHIEAFSRKTRSGASAAVEDIYESSTGLYGHPTNTIRPDDLLEAQSEGRVHRVLVLGTAGIGKSTLSEYLCYLWASSIDDASKKSFLKKYRWVFRIPLRNLTAERYPKEQSVRMIDVLERECLSLAVVRI